MEKKGRTLGMGGGKRGTRRADLMTRVSGLGRGASWMAMSECREQGSRNGTRVVLLGRGAEEEESMVLLCGMSAASVLTLGAKPCGCGAHPHQSG